jgi:hypothetical protein
VPLEKGTEAGGDDDLALDGGDSRLRVSAVMGDHSENWPGAAVFIGYRSGDQADG